MNRQPLLIFVATLAHAQSRGVQTPKAAAPVDLTGYWVSVVTEDWRFRIMTPAKGDFPSIPLNTEGRKVALAWDPAKDEAADESCKAYGLGNIMHMPGRPQPPTGAPDRQGFSIPQWEFAGGGRGRGAQAGKGGNLKVVTTHMSPGYLQKNGVPYSADAVITEHFDALEKEPNGDQWLIVTTLVNDPQYLNQPPAQHPFQAPDATAWDPSPCIAR